MYYQQGKKQQDIADELTALGYQVSKGAVHRAIKSQAQQLKELKRKQDWAKVLTEETSKTPRLDITDAALQIASMKLLEEVSEIENFQEMEPEKKIVLLTKVSRAIGLAANVELNFERGRKQGLLEAEKKLEENAGPLGIGDDKMAIIRARVFGLNTK
jgi:hypothetical protein